MKDIKKRTIIIILTIIVVFAIGFIGIYWYNHPTHYLFEDRWIIGKDAVQIQERYGKYDKDLNTEKGYCVQPYRTDFFFGEPVWAKYYMIYFNENGNAYKVDVVEWAIGG